jgi:hypothetical protein
MDVRKLVFSPIFWGLFGGVIGYVTSLLSPVVSFFVATALWSLLVSLGLLVYGIWSPDPRDLLDVLTHESAALPLALLYVVCGGPAVLWVFGYIPFVPPPGVAWPPQTVAVATVIMVVWFLVGTFVGTLLTFAVADGVRRLTGRRGLQWTEKNEP